MANIIDVPQLPDWEDLETMSRQELLNCLETVQEQIARLDEEEPEDMDSEAYDDWGDRHEELEDLADEITDRLEAWED